MNNDHAWKKVKARIGNGSEKLLFSKLIAFFGRARFFVHPIV